MKAEKKASEKEAKVKEQEVKESNDTGAQNACGDEETLDPNVRFIFFMPAFDGLYSLKSYSIPQPVQGRIYQK